jgi:glutaredoxin
MKLLLKIGAVLSVSILLISSIYIVSSMESEKPESSNNNNNNKNNTNSYIIDNEDKNKNQGLLHTVFVEDGTATWCNNCPVAEDILHKMYNSDNPDFYYVSMIDDENSKVHQRLYNDYNVLGFPTIFIDGGYRVIMGSNNFESVFKEKISAAKSRDKPALHLNVTAVLNESRDQMKIHVFIENYETKKYAGRLKVYLTEINSALNNYEHNPYHFGFLDYIINEEITIDAKESKSKDKTWDVSSLDPDNLMIIATVFNLEGHQTYSDPPSNKQAFTAYYADATNGTLAVAGGNLPPEVGITSHQNGKIYLNDKLFLKNLYKNSYLKNTILIGKATIKAYAKDDSKIEKVEFYLDNDLVATFTSGPYEWKWTKTTIGRHTLKVIAYDDTGKSSTDSIDVVAFINLIGLLSP